MKSIVGIVTAVTALLTLCIMSEAAVVGIDFGTHWIKAAVARPGFFDVVENEINDRKTSSAVAFAPPPDEQRVLGKTGLRVLFRRPKTVFLYPSHLLGRFPETDVAAKTDMSHFPFDTTVDPERGTYLLTLNESYSFAPEELVGMVLRYVRQFAASSSKLTTSQLQDCVITVPSFATMHERQAMVDAAKLAGLNVIALLSTPAAFAVTYGMEKAPLNETQNLVIIDMGAAALEAAFVSVTNTINERKHQEVSLVNVRTSAWNRNIGGRDFVRRLTRLVMRRSGLNDAIDSPDRRTYYRAEAVASKLMEVLSVNKDAHFKISMPEADYEGTITRDEFEEECKDLLEQISAPLKAAMERIEWTNENITYVQIVGGATRIPAVQKVLMDLFGKDDLQRHLSGDEGGAFGATYLAAQMSSSHRSKKTFVLRDATPYSVGVFTPDGNTTLYKAGARYGYSRSLIYTSNSTEFDVSLKFIEPSFQHEEMNCNGDISTYHISGITTKAEHPNMTTDVPNVRMTFTLSMTGAIELTEVNAEFNETIVVQEKRQKNSTNTENETAEATNETEPASATPEETKETAEEEKPSNEAETPEETKENVDANSTNETTNETAEAKTELPPVIEYEYVEKVVVVPRKVQCNVELIKQCLAPRTSEEIHKMTKRLDAFDDEDQARRLRQETHNAIESYVYKMREILGDETKRAEMAKYAKDGVLEAIEANLSVAFDWLEDEGEDATLDVLKVKLDELRAEGDKIEYRMAEAEERPKAINLLRYSIQYTNESLYNATEKRNITEEELQRTANNINDVKIWLQEKLAEQLKQAPNEDPALTTADIDEKMDDLTYYLKWIRSRPFKKIPKKPVNETKNETDTNSTNSTEEGNENQTKTEAEGAETPEENQEQQPEGQQEQQQPIEEEKNAEQPVDEMELEEPQNDNEKKEL